MNRRTRQYEEQPVILEAKIGEVSFEPSTRGSFTKLSCEVTDSRHRNFNHMSGKPATVYLHPSALPKFKEGDKIIIYATPKKIEDSTITDPKRIDKMDGNDSMMSRYFS